jgi:AI-2E family transporter
MRSRRLMYRRFPFSKRPGNGGCQLGSHSSLSPADRPLSAHEPAPLNLSPTNPASARRKRMSDQVMNERPAEQSQVGMAETAVPFSTPPSDKMLGRITILLFILVAGLLTVFGYYASSICITVILAGFLAILFDPVVVILEKLHLPRSVAAAGIVLAGMSLVGLLGYVLYGRVMGFAEELPVYASKVQQTIEPISRKIQNFQQSAGNLANDVHATKKVPEVRCRIVVLGETGNYEGTSGRSEEMGKLSSHE